MAFERTVLGEKREKLAGRGGTNFFWFSLFFLEDIKSPQKNHPKGKKEEQQDKNSVSDSGAAFSRSLMAGYVLSIDGFMSKPEPGEKLVPRAAWGLLKQVGGHGWGGGQWKSLSVLLDWKLTGLRVVPLVHPCAPRGSVSNGGCQLSAISTI